VATEKESFVSSSSAFLPDDGQCAFVGENGVVEKHIAGHVVDVTAFTDPIRIMLRPDETERIEKWIIQ
jgi:hypothetical protein